MRIGIYNRYWNTFGGGENYTGSVAQVLSEEHQVELISVEPVDWTRLQARLRLDLSRCTMRQWPNDSCTRLSLLSAEYELFINSTYGSSITPQSKISALICYFPHRIDRFARLRSSVGSLAKDIVKPRFKWPLVFRHGLPDIVPISGTYPLEPDARCWVGASALLSVAASADGLLRIPLWPGAYCGIKAVTMNGLPCTYRIDDNKLIVTPPEPAGNRRAVFISSIPMAPVESGISSDARHLGACLDTRNSSWGDHPDFVAKVASGKGASASLASYDRIISISEFTTEWITKRWKLPSYELQPPIDTETFNYDPSAIRERLVLSVGRFFAGGHNKKHHEMAKAFIRMREEGHISEEWRLALVGARHREHSRHIVYFDKLQRLCEGHPIDIKTDLPFIELLEYYRKASIYWHAAGWGERVYAYPERFEHFGMTTCEAMACGCVPVVFDGAGQREIVTDDDTGYLFKDYAMLAQRMRALTAAYEERSFSQMGEKARNSIARYARSGFRERVKSAFQGIAY